MFTDKDLQLFAHKGISKELILSQIEKFKTGFPFSQLTAAATLNKGVLRFDQAAISAHIDYYDQFASDADIIKMVPASGAASRMFKDLFEFRAALKDDFDLSSKDDSATFLSAREFFSRLNEFAFYPSLIQVLKNSNIDSKELLNQKDYGIILDFLLDEKGLNYSNLPKALLLFHRYENANRLAMEEHLVEGANYARSKNDVVKIHFTVSKEHKLVFEHELKRVIPKYETQFGLSYEVSLSEQKESTDTIAVDMDNQAFRELDGSILFRPGGHGALIENLNDLDTEIVFIKNIDNIVPDSLREPTYLYKKVLGAHLLILKKQLFGYLEMLDQASFTEEDLADIISFVKDQLMIPLTENFDTMDTIEKLDYLFSKMNRPIRVCGMVKNEGEPGGGPFWVRSQQEDSLQIVEGSQIDVSNSKQKRILDSATHFNPVDLVCSLKNYQGKAFNLLDFVDPNTGFISKKSKDGRELKAQELPGLWNGAMANWITIFVEVPIETFNPVKSVNDLLRIQHQGT